MLEVVDVLEEKVVLYRGYRCRVACQQRAIEEVHASMKQRCLDQKSSDEAIIVLDFKMKWESKRYRELTSQHFGKRGWAWHAFVVTYYEYREASADGAVPRSAERRLVYSDQVIEGDNKQDGDAVISLSEAFFAQLRRDLPHIHKMTLQSDNAAYYHSKVFIVLVPLVALRYGFEIVRIIRTETQDGKGLVDAHFATSTRKVNAYIAEGHDAATPLQVRQS